MKTMTPMEAALAGLLCERPRHAYEIEKTIEERDMRYWTEISMSSVYKLLRKLERDGLVKSAVRLSKRNRAQKVYSVTPQGRQALRNTVKKLASEWTKPIWPVDIALSNLSLLSPREFEDCFAKYIESLDRMLACYGELRKYLEAHCPFQNVQLAIRPLALLKAEKEWAETFRRQYIAKSKSG